MGAVMTKLKLTNSVDVANARSGLIPPEQIRTIEIEALVDTGASTLVLPEDIVSALGVHEVRRVSVRVADGSIRWVPKVGDLRIEILGREMFCDALVVPAGATPLIGQIPLEELDLVIDPKSREITVHPDRPNEPLLYLLRVG
jgi:clan AA aspartic protease